MPPGRVESRRAFLRGLLGSSSDTATRIALRANGLDPDTDVTIAALGSLQNRLAAMTNRAG